MKKSLGWVICLLVLGTFGLAGVTFKVKVRVQTASVRMKPDVRSEVIGYAVLGEVLDASEKTGEWFAVSILSKDKKSTLSGYINYQSVVEEAERLEQPQAPAAKPLVRAPQQEPPPSISPLSGTEERSAKISEKDLDQLALIESKIRQESIAFLNLIKEMRPEEGGITQARAVDMVRVIIDGCNVYETMDTRSNVIYRPRINDEFEILERNDEFYKISLKDGRQGWIAESCIQVFSARKSEAKVKFQGVGSSEIKAFLEAASALFARISQEKLVADQIIKNYRSEAAAESSEYQRILKSYNYAREFYGQFVENKSIDLDGQPSFLSKLSAWTELLFGSSSFQTQYLGKRADKNSGMIRDLSAGTSLQFNESSQVNFKISNKKDIIQTPFATNEIDAGYSYARQDSLNFQAGVNMNTYTDDLNDLNDYSRLTLRTAAGYQVAPKTNFDVNYSFMRNAFSQNEGNNYIDHSLLAKVRMKSGDRSEFALQLRSSLESGKSAFYKFTNLEPSLGYSRGTQDSRLDLRFLYEVFRYSELKLRSYNRAAFVFNSSKRLGDSSRLYAFSVTSKGFPGNAQAGYLQIQGKYSATRSRRMTTSFSPSFTTNLYGGKSSNSFTDFRMDISSSSSAFFSDLSAFIRYWHSPSEGGRAKKPRPHVFDLTGKAGINLKYLKIGPSFGLHALISSEDGVEFFKRDGNLIRFGAIVEGSIPLPRNISLTLNGAYEYGFVYNNEVSVNTQTGEIREGDVLMRHPTTFQVNSTITVPVFRSFELIGKLDFYKIDTDMNAKLSINPVTQNKRFTFLLGLKYRFN